MRDDARLFFAPNNFFLFLSLSAYLWILSIAERLWYHNFDIYCLTLTHDSNDSVVYAMSATSFRMTVTSSRSRQWRVLDVD